MPGVFPTNTTSTKGSAVTIAAVSVVIIAALLAAIIGLVIMVLLIFRRAKRSVIVVVHTNDGENDIENTVYSGRHNLGPFLYVDSL